MYILPSQSGCSGIQLAVLGMPVSSYGLCSSVPPLLWSMVCIMMHCIRHACIEDERALHDKMTGTKANMYTSVPNSVLLRQSSVRQEPDGGTAVVQCFIYSTIHVVQTKFPTNQWTAPQALIPFLYTLTGRLQTRPWFVLSPPFQQPPAKSESVRPAAR